MDTQKITDFFTRPNKSILGICSTLSTKWSISPLVLRIALILLTLIFIPLGIIAYIILYLLIDPKKNKIITFGIIGMVLGIPLSYYFQSDVVRLYGGGSGMISYLKNFITIVDQYDAYVGNGWDIIYNVFLSIVIFTVIGGGIGYFIDKKEADKGQP